MKVAKAGDQKFLQTWNRNIVLNMIYQAGNISRVEIAKRTKLSQSTVTGIVSVLQEKGQVVEVGMGESTRSGGRRPTFLTINAKGGYVIGIAIITEAFHITLQLSLFDLKLKPVFEKEKIVNKKGIDLINEIQSVTDEIINENKDKNIIGLGLSIPTVLDQSGIIQRGHLLDLEQYPIEAELKRMFPDLNILIEQEQHAALLGEKTQSPANSVANLIYVTVGRGIGASIMVNNQIIRGAYGGAGEIGHMVINMYGEKCICGKNGCLRLYSTELSFINKIKEAVELGIAIPDSIYDRRQNKINVLEVYKEAMHGEPFCRDVVRSHIDSLSIALSNLMYLFNPEMIVLGGNILLADEFVIPYIQKSLTKLMDYPNSEIVITSANLKGKSALYGVANLVHNQFFLKN